MHDWDKQTITGADVAKVDAYTLAPAMTKSEMDKLVRSIDRRCRGPLIGDAKVVSDKALVQAAGGGMSEPSPRKGCGQDYNDLIVANPYDGKDHEVICPKCGTKSAYRAPTF